MSSSFFAFKAAFAGLVGTTVVGGSVYGTYVMFDSKDDSTKDVKVDAPKQQESSVPKIGDVPAIQETQTVVSQDSVSSPEISVDAGSALPKVSTQSTDSDVTQTKQQTLPAGGDSGGTHGQAGSSDTTRTVTSEQVISSAESQKSISKDNIFVIVESETTVNDLEQATLETADSSKNYKCKVENDESSTKSDCSIKKLSITDTNKKYYKWSEISDASWITVDNDSLKQANNLFKIEVTQTFSDSLKTDGVFAKNIEVVLNTSSDNKKFGKLKPLFGFSDSDFISNTSYSVGKVSKITGTDAGEVEGPITINTEETKCNFSSGTDQDAKTEVKCVINDFGGSAADFSDITFTGTVTAQTTINKDKYYLFNLSDNATKTINEFKSFTTNTVSVEESGQEPKKINTLELTDLNPAIVAGASNSQIVFFIG